MKQVSKNGGKKKSTRKPTDKRLPPKPKVKTKRKHKEFGTSKLEQDFARDFLDKLGVRYTWQFPMESIGRYLDYYLDDYRVAIEVNGEYWHADPRIYEGKELTPTQKRDLRVDEQKRMWCLIHGIPLIVVWEKDIKDNPVSVMNMLRERLKVQTDIIDRENGFKKRHVNKLNG